MFVGYNFRRLKKTTKITSCEPTKILTDKVLHISVKFLQRVTWYRFKQAGYYEASNLMF